MTRQLGSTPASLQAVQPARHLLEITSACADCDDNTCAGCVIEPLRHYREIECPGVTSACCDFTVCQRCRRRSPFLLAAGEIVEAHGVLHYPGDGAWLIASSTCLLTTSPFTLDAIVMLNLPPGRYDVVNYEFEDGVRPRLWVARRPEPAAALALV